MFLVLLSKIIRLHIHEFISGLSILFHWSMCLFLMSVPYCFGYYSFVIWFDISMRPPALFFFLKIVLAIQDPFRFHMNFRMALSISAKNAVGRPVVLESLVGIYGSESLLELCVSASDHFHLVSAQISEGSQEPADGAPDHTIHKCQEWWPPAVCLS